MKYNSILIRFSEIGLKSRPVKRRFIKKLMNNIRSGLKLECIEAKVQKRKERIIVETDQIKKACELLKHVFGVVSFSPCIRLTLNELNSFVKKHAEELVAGETFAVRVRRVGKHRFTSQELASKLGDIIVKKIKKKVDLSHPESELFVEVRQNDVYVFTEKTHGPGGMPLGSQGKVVCYVSDNYGIVATWLMMKRGCYPIVCYTVPVDILDKWSYGIKLKKIKVEKLENVKEIAKRMNIPAVLADNLEKNGIKKLQEMNKMFKLIFHPIIGFKKQEIQEFYKKIKQ